jgi:hypothetical protein
MKNIVLEKMFISSEDIVMTDSVLTALNQQHIKPLVNPDSNINHTINSTEPSVMLHMDEYDTGDILLFSDKTYIPSLMIEYFSGSIYSHVAIILKDPIYIKPELKGLYILESTGLTDICDVENHKIKNGVQIRKLEDVCRNYNGAIFWRKLNIIRDDKFYQTIADVHTSVHNKPYDFNPKDWIEALLNVQLGNVHLTTQFFCSAMVTYIYYRLNLVDENTPWTIIRPKDLGTEFSTIPSRFFTNDVCRIKIINCSLDNEIAVRSYDMYLHYIYRTY